MTDLIRRPAPGILQAMRLLALLGLTFAAACAPPDSGRGDMEVETFVELGRAEDARPSGGRDLERLVGGTRAATPFLRRVAVRGLGRLEEPELAEHIVPLLDDPAPEVRAQAADALAQAHHRGSGSPALAPLLDRAAREENPDAASALARALGRLALGPEERRVAGEALVRLSVEPGEEHPRALVGAALGMESMARLYGGEALAPGIRGRLRELAVYRDESGSGPLPGPDPADGPRPEGGVGLPAPSRAEVAARIRTVALLGLAAADAGAGDSIPGLVDTALGDSEPSVRRAGVELLATEAPTPDDPRLRILLGDPEPRVRAAAVGLVSSLPRSAAACALLLDAAEDDDMGVRLTALEGLAEPCPQGGEQRALLRATASSLGQAERWHPAGPALVALAELEPDAARTLLPRFLEHPNPFVRTWGARAAGVLGEAEILRGLLRDPDPNVLAAALPALAGIRGRAADDVLLAVVAERTDPQLVMTAARLLEVTDRREAATMAALVGLRHLSEERLQTHRDARLALLDLLAATGDSTRTTDVEPYLRDYDAAVADRTSELLMAWTGRRWIAAPRGSESLPFPTPEELRAMDGAVVRLHMARGGAVDVRLLPWTAPTNAARLYRLAEGGRLDGLTFHRVVENFVIQGGSPGANEYMGHGAYTRDEVGLVAQWRGTVGLSTRGRDTGDGQIYVNLVDNVRLDHDYTILGRVVAGMDVVDRVQEGDVIERAEIVARVSGTRPEAPR